MQTVVNAIIHRRHFWKKVKFDELSELYMSLTLRALGLSLIGIFIPVYLWKQGFAIEDIALFYVVMHAFRLFVDPVVGISVSKYGPKHVIRVAALLQVIFLLVIIAVGNNLLPLWVAPFLMAIAISSFIIPFHADFSNVRSANKVGRQLSSLTILEKIAGALGPLAGGVIATWYSFETTIIVALILVLLSALPLFVGGEHVNQKTFHYKFKWANYKHITDEAIVYIGRGFELSIFTLLWPMFAAITIFASEVYAGLGFITALGLGSTLLSAHLIGKIVDNKKGRTLFRAGISVGSFLHYVRPFVTSIPGAAVISAVGESATSAVNMPLMKGYYYHANHYKYGRVAYIISAISILHVSRFTSYGLLYIFLLYVTPPTAFAMMLFVAGSMSWLMLGERFKALDE